MHSLDLNLRNITKIEGHANLLLKVRNKRVERVEFSPYENNRFFEKIVLGRHYSEIPGIVARICGFCSAAHLTTALEACENALGIAPSEQTFMLRELLAMGGAIKSHALHLYFLALPDYLGKGSALEFSGRQHRHIHQALRIKKAGTTILDRIGGRALHVLSAKAGGFAKLPSREDLLAVGNNLKAARKDAIDAIELFSSLKPPVEFRQGCEYLAHIGKGYCLLCGDVQTSSGLRIPEERYRDYLHVVCVPYSTAKQVELCGESFMVGALARLNIHRKEMLPSVKKEIKKQGLKFPSQDPFDNNTAQALELLQFIDSSLGILKDMKLRNEKPKVPEIRRPSSGLGITEAPRGTLFHEYSLNSSGRITNAKVIVPTNQNGRRIEDDLRAFVPQILHKTKKEATLDIERLIRAYDPCISCATHFLRVRWL